MEPSHIYKLICDVHDLWKRAGNYRAPAGIRRVLCTMALELHGMLDNGSGLWHRAQRKIVEMAP